MLLLPADLVTAICGRLEAGVVRQLGASLGKQAGTRIRSRLAQVSTPSLEVMVDQLGGELSLAGFGSLSVERWGQALVARVSGYPLAGQGQELLGGYFEGALQTAVEREVTALPLERSEQALRFLLCGKAASSTVKGWLLGGASWADALASLQGAKNGAIGARV